MVVVTTLEELREATGVFGCRDCGWVLLLQRGKALIGWVTTDESRDCRGDLHLVAGTGSDGQVEVIRSGQHRFLMERLGHEDPLNDSGIVIPS